MNELLFEYKVRYRYKTGYKEFSFYATTEIEEFLNRNSIDYVRNMTDTVESRLFKENKRLNNIINELEKYFFGQLQLYGGGGTAKEYYDYLQELKGSNRAIPPEVIGTNGEDGGLFDYGDR